PATVETGARLGGRRASRDATRAGGGTALAELPSAMANGAHSGTSEADRVDLRRPSDGFGWARRPRTSMSVEEEYVAFARGSIAAPGLTTTRSVRLSVRSPRSGPHVLRIESAAGNAYTLRFTPTEDLARSDGTFSILYPPEDDSSPALEPGTPHRFTLHHEAS